MSDHQFAYDKSDEKSFLVAGNVATPEYAPRQVASRRPLTKRIWKFIQAFVILCFLTAAYQRYFGTCSHSSLSQGKLFRFQSLTDESAVNAKPAQPEPIEVIGADFPLTNLSDYSVAKEVVLTHDFGNSWGKPYVVKYKPSTSNFTQVYLTFNITSNGHQFDRLGHIFVSGSEIWRFSTAEPGNRNITFSAVKDVSDYASLLKNKKVEFAVLLNNILNDKYTGSFNLTLTAEYFYVPKPAVASSASIDEAVTKNVSLPVTEVIPITDGLTYFPTSLDSSAAKTFTALDTKFLTLSGAEDVPELVSASSDEYGQANDYKVDQWVEKVMDRVVSTDSTNGFDVKGAKKCAKAAKKTIDAIASKNVDFSTFAAAKGADLYTLPAISNDTFKAEVHIFASGNADEEFWYEHLSDTAIGKPEFKKHYPFRLVEVYINDVLAGEVLPFPVIYTGGIAPQLWNVIAGIAAYDVPSYKVDITPFLPLLWGKESTISFKIVNGMTPVGPQIDSNWIVSASLLLKQDPAAIGVSADIPPLSVAARKPKDLVLNFPGFFNQILSLESNVTVANNLTFLFANTTQTIEVAVDQKHKYNSIMQLSAKLQNVIHIETGVTTLSLNGTSIKETNVSYPLIYSIKGPGVPGDFNVSISRSKKLLVDGLESRNDQNGSASFAFVGESATKGTGNLTQSLLFYSNATEKKYEPDFCRTLYANNGTLVWDLEGPACVAKKFPGKVPVF